ncbi:hypothetical protein [Campylobacter majalis]|uniref:hypothetical protein n=1 Tax=Campylobacter majalis TaxID=2790656 RepID=UPI003D688303
MKKLVFVLLVFIALVFGFIKFANDKIVKAHDTAVEKLQNSTHAEVIYDTLQSEILSSQSTIGLLLQTALGELKVEIVTQASKNPLNVILQKSSANFVVKILETDDDFMLKFMSDILATGNIKAGLKNYDVSMKFQDLDYDGLIFKDIQIDSITTTNYLMQSAKLMIGDVLLDQGYVKNIVATTYSDTPLSVYDFLNTAYYGKSLIKIDEISIADQYTIKDVFLDSKFVKNDKSLGDSKDLLKIGSYTHGDMIIKDISMIGGIKNFNLVSFNETMKSLQELDTQSDNYLNDANKIYLENLPKFLSHDLKYAFELKATSNKNNKIDIVFDISIDDFDKYSGELGERILQSLKMNSKIIFSPNFSEFFSNLESLKEMEDSLKAQGFIIDENGKSVINLVYDKERSDVIVNDTLPLWSTIFMLFAGF